MTRLNNKWLRYILLFAVMVAVVRPCLAVDFSPVYTSINGRDFGYYVPESYDGSKPVPLLFMFHGMGGNNSEASGGSADKWLLWMADLCASKRVYRPVPSGGRFFQSLESKQ